MAEKVPQTFANHTRFDPLYHFFAIPVFALALLAAIIHLFAHITSSDFRDNFHAVALVLLASALVVTVLKLRLYALRNQDRIIRLEERLRLATLLSDRLRSRIPELTDAQLIAIRFASDAEVPGLVERALNEKLSRSDIKKAIQNWRPDYSRI